MSTVFSGVITALVTPFHNNALDVHALGQLFEHQAKGGIKTVVVAGSTGENTTLSYEEYLKLANLAVELGKKYHINVVIGVGFNSTVTATKAVAELNTMKPSGIMCTVPAYNKPTQNGLLEHFKALHEVSNMPMMLYSVPSRTGSDFKDATLEQLASFPKIEAFKDAGSDIERPLRLSKTKLKLFSGDDGITLAHMAHGAVGVVSVLSNIIPKEMSDVVTLFANHKYKEALELQRKIVDLCKAIFLESNPIGIKYATSKIGLCKNELRLPLTAATSETTKNIDLAMVDFLEPK